MIEDFGTVLENLLEWLAVGSSLRCQFFVDPLGICRRGLLRRFLGQDPRFWLVPSSTGLVFVSSYFR